MGPKVFINCSGFIKIDSNSLGDSRGDCAEFLNGFSVHPESHELAADVLDCGVDNQDEAIIFIPDESESNDTSPPIKLYSCGKCFFKTQSLKHYNDHIKKHEMTVIDSTSIQMRQFDDCFEELMQQNNSETEGDVQIEFVDLMEQNKEEETYAKVLVDYEAFACCMCPMRFVHKSEWIEHETNLHPERSFKCGECRFRALSNNKLQSHMMKHSKVLKFKCDICEQLFKNKSVLKRHSQVHSQVRPFECERCHKRFKYKRSKERHEIFKSCKDLLKRKNNENKPFTCNLCKRSYKSRSTFESHFKKICMKRTRKFVIFSFFFNLFFFLFLVNVLRCDLCGEEFAFNKNLEKHIFLNHQTI
jgi:hypothetical protein